MTPVGDRLEPPPPATVVEVAGDLDASTALAFEHRLMAAVARGHSVVVDLGDCTFIDGRGARLLGDVYALAARVGVPLCVVLPYSAASTVRRLLLEFAPDLVPYPIVPDRSSASTAACSDLAKVPSGADRIRELKAGFWEAASRCERLLADRDALILTQRQALAEYRSRSARRGESR